jgi:hypothetical protein
VAEEKPDEEEKPGCAATYLWLAQSPPSAHPGQSLTSQNLTPFSKKQSSRSSTHDTMKEKVGCHGQGLHVAIKDPQLTWQLRTGVDMAIKDLIEEDYWSQGFLTAPWNAVGSESSLHCTCKQDGSICTLWQGAGRMHTHMKVTFNTLVHETLPPWARFRDM